MNRTSIQSKAMAVHGVQVVHVPLDQQMKMFSGSRGVSCRPVIFQLATSESGTLDGLTIPHVRPIGIDADFGHKVVRLTVISKFCRVFYNLLH